VADIVKKPSKSDQIPIVIRDFRNLLVSVHPKNTAVLSISCDRSHHFLGGLDDSQAMRVSSVRGSWINVVSHRQLLDSSEPLNEGRIQEQRFPRVEIDTSPNGIVNRFWEELRMSYASDAT
jgi:hypothetical protein